MNEITKEDVIDELQRLDAEYDKISRSIIEKHGKINHTTMANKFDSLTNAYEEANVLGSKHKISKENILEDFKQVYDKVNGPVRIGDYKQHSRYSYTSLLNRVGGIEEAHEKLGLRYTKKSPYTVEEIEKELKRIDDEYDKVTGEIIDKYGNISVKTVYRVCGSLTEKLKELDIDTEGKSESVSKNDIVEDVKKLHEELGRTVKIEDYRDKGEYSYETIRNKIGGMERVYDETKLDYNVEPIDNVNKEDVLEDMNNVYDKLDTDIITSNQYREHGKYGIGTIQKYFENFKDAKIQAGVEHDQDELFRKWEEIIDEKELAGRFTSYELSDYLPEYYQQRLSVFIDWHIEQDNDTDFEIRNNPKPCSNQSGRTIFIHRYSTYSEYQQHILDKYEEELDDIDEKYYDIIFDLIGQGRAPKTAIGTLKWMLTDKSQNDIGICTSQSIQIVAKVIRKNYDIEEQN